MKKLYLIATTFFNVKMMSKMADFLVENCFYVECHGDYFIVETLYEKQILFEMLYNHMSRLENKGNIYITNTDTAELELNFPLPPDYNYLLNTHYGDNTNEEIDEILEKIHEFGMAALTDFERLIIGVEDGE